MTYFVSNGILNFNSVCGAKHHESSSLLSFLLRTTYSRTGGFIQHVAKAVLLAIVCQISVIC